MLNKSVFKGKQNDDRGVVECFKGTNPDWQFAYGLLIIRVTQCVCVKGILKNTRAWHTLKQKFRLEVGAIN